MTEFDCGNADDIDDEFVPPSTIGVEERCGKGLTILLYTFAAFGAAIVGLLIGRGVMWLIGLLK